MFFYEYWDFDISMLQNQHTSILVRARVYNNVRARVGTK